MNIAAASLNQLTAARTMKRQMTRRRVGKLVELRRTLCSKKRKANYCEDDLRGPAGDLMFYYKHSLDNLSNTPKPIERKVSSFQRLFRGTIDNNMQNVLLRMDARCNALTRF